MGGEGIALPAGRAVRRAARETGAIFAPRGTATCGSVQRGRRPADEQSQCRIVRPLRLTLAQRLRVDRVEHRTPDRIDHRNHDFQAARRIEHDSIESVCMATIDADQVTYRSGLHNFELTAHTAREYRSVGKPTARYGEGIDPERDRLRTARELARAVDDGRNVGAALRHLDIHGSEPEAQSVADALARFLVARCDSHHAGWRVVRQVVVDSAADAPWEKCARRAVPVVAQDLIDLSGDRGRTLLVHAQHIAAQRRAEEIAVHVDQSAVLKDLGLRCPAATPDRWRDALSCAVRARSREQVARAVDGSLRE